MKKMIHQKEIEIMQKETMQDKKTLTETQKTQTKFLQEETFQQPSQDEIDCFFMKEAIKEAKKAKEANEVPVGAVLVFQNKIISRGYNQVELLQDATAHAEMICLTAGAGHLGNWRLLDTTLYCTLEPCMMCAGAIIASRVKRVVFGAKDLRVGAAGSFINLFSIKHPIHQVRIEVIENILAEESAFLLQEFFQKTRKKN